MRWCYKTVHFEQKKEGLLGNAYIDELEIEETLNDFGKSGWELVSMLEVRDGVIAVFKQPLMERSHETDSDLLVEDRNSPEFTKQEAVLYSDDEQISDEEEFAEVFTSSFPEATDYADSELADEDEGGDDADEQNDSGVGSIRIE